ncbi:MAG: tetratricopeptide repeat protein [Gemmatimonadaceae bacterium]|nr:tetratricopeptide repeat protein [Gemmatimonadaceae bacterium]
MSTAARIDELRKKFEENPRRYFAPLANEYRKAGDLSQAIALCREHLPKQPGHMSGFIVFGQALYESGELEEARTVFEQAIDLDPENLIALRHLGDIAQAMGDESSARRWWGRVLDADPRNDDIAAQLATLTTEKPQSSNPAVPSFDNLSRMTETPTVPMTPIGFGVAPTPDSVMRAIDMDAVSARLRQRTPIDLDAVDATTSSTSASEALGVAEAPDAEELVAEVVGAVAEPAPDAFGFPEDAGAHKAPAYEDEEDFGDVVIDASDESFEEGLIAVEWPDTSELVARVLTPRALTPREATPIASPTIDDTVSAFGREPSDPAPVNAERPELVAMVDDFDSVPDVQVEVTGTADEAVVASAADEADEGAEVDEAWHMQSAGETAGDADAELPHIDSVVPSGTVMEGAFDAFLETAVESNVEEGFADAPELPWLAMAEEDPTSPTDTEPAEPGLEAIAEAFAGDARAAGDEGPMTVAAREDSPSFGESESFADVAMELVAESMSNADAPDGAPPASFVDTSVAEDGDAADDQRESGTPAFVTETMGELLVSQGFVARAIDVYEELVRRRPYDPVLASRLDELRAMMASSADAAPAGAFSTASTIDEEFAAELEATFSGEDEGHSPQPATDLTYSAAPLPTPVHGTPAYGTPAYGTPAYGTPAFATPLVTPRMTPYAQPAVAEDFLPRRSAREWFAAIAARRVPRRTPPQSAAAIDSSPEGLASLFGNETSAQDDEAAQALADAFAPVSAHELESGAALDFEFARTTPSFSPTVDASSSLRSPSITPVIGQSAFTSHGGSTSTPSSGSNAGFSFDRFFPDPATRRPTPSTSAPVTPEAPVTDDLAQFSAWLKGLGNS